MSQIPDLINDVGKGWHPILEELHGAISCFAPNYIAGQVKEKFGTLRIYLDRVPDEEGEFFTDYPSYIYELIYEAEAKSATVCEFCGEPGTPKGGVWIKTLCGSCK